MDIKNLRIFGFENAILGMRFPKNSEKNIDSIFNENCFEIGKKDGHLMLNLCKAGKSHRKFLRMIHVQMSINMPIGWWIQMDTYKIGSTANSRSRMYKFGSRDISINDFFLEHKSNFMDLVIKEINFNIKKYNKAKKEGNIDKARKYWKIALDILPMSFCQERMWDANYEVLFNILFDRYNEKLKLEWRFFCDFVLENCPFLKEAFFYTINK